MSGPSLAHADAAAAWWPPRVTATRRLDTPEAVHFTDAWQVSGYRNLCFSGRRWHLAVQQRADLPRLKEFGSAAFARFPLRAQAVTNRTEVLARQACWRGGTTFVADLKHGGGPTSTDAGAPTQDQ